MRLRDKIYRVIFGDHVMDMVKDYRNGKGRLYLNDPVTAIIVGSLIVGGAAVGSAAYSAKQEKKSQQRLLSHQEEQVRKAEEKARGVEALAAQEASDTLKKRRQAQTRTILTSPLGVADDALTGKTTLLGG